MLTLSLQLWVGDSGKVLSPHLADGETGAQTANSSVQDLAEQLRWCPERWGRVRLAPPAAAAPALKGTCKAPPLESSIHTVSPWINPVAPDSG